MAFRVIHFFPQSCKSGIAGSAIAVTRGEAPRAKRGNPAELVHPKPARPEATRGDPKWPESQPSGAAFFRPVIGRSNRLWPARAPRAAPSPTALGRPR